MIRNAALLLFCAALGLWPRPAAAEQRELQLGVQPVYGITYVDQRSPSGGGGNAHLGYGITDALGLQLSGGATVHPVSELKDEMLPAGTLLTWHGSLSVVYALDVVRVVPFFEAGLGALGTQLITAKEVTNTVDLGVTLGLGADYLLTRRWAVGVLVRYHAMLTDLSRLPLYLTVGPRVVLRFGF